MQSFDVVIVGAGPAGIGMALELRKIDGLQFCVLESERIGESFRRWPAQTRLITPSFNSNPFGLADLNAVDELTSPAIFAGAEHLSGNQYADYLSTLVEAADLPVGCDCKVLQVYAYPEGGFHLITDFGELHTEYLIWACGEYQFPDLNSFPGAHLCTHYAHIEDWQQVNVGDHIVIGGYESGLDAAINLLKLGSRVRLLVRKPTWDLPDVSDPSLTLSPYTRERLREVESNDRLEIVYGADVVKITDNNESDIIVHAADGRSWTAKQSPILGTGFVKGGGAVQIADLWTWDNDGRIQLSDLDESLQTPGLFLVGPQVRQDQLIYCFIYKFRQRFARIANQICLRMQGFDTSESTIDNAWGPFGNTECCEGCEC